MLVLSVSSSAAMAADGLLKTEPDSSAEAGRFLEFKLNFEEGFFMGTSCFGMGALSGSPSPFRNSHSASKFLFGAMSSQGMP